METKNIIAALQIISIAGIWTGSVLSHEEETISFLFNSGFISHPDREGNLLTITPRGLAALEG